MVSRKRNKGKERKAKKTLTLANKTMKEAEAFLQEWEKIVCSFWRALSCGVICDAIFDPTHTGTMFVIQDFARGRIVALLLDVAMGPQLDHTIIITWLKDLLIRISTIGVGWGKM